MPKTTTPLIRKRFTGLLNPSSLVLLAITAYLFVITVRVRDPKISSWDNFGYYLYLPQTFIEHDPGNHDLAALNKARVQYEFSPWLYQVHDLPNGNHLSQYPIGMACFYSPAFAVGHLVAKTSGYATDGYSPPYQYSLLWLSTLCCVAGLFILRKFLKRYFNDWLTAALLAIVFLGTNYYVYATVGFGSPHIFLFMAFAAMLELNARWHQAPSFKNSFALGFVISLMTVSRPTEVLIVLVVLFWQVYSFKDLRNKFVLIFGKRRPYFFMALAGFLPLILLQLLYWKIYAGQTFYFSYANPGEGFELLHPHLTEFLFSFRKGWFVYTPIMFFAVIGLLVAKRRQHEFRTAFLVFACVNIFVLSCWSNWWYATSFGQRALIQSYPIFLFGLGLLYERIRASKPLRIFSATVAVFLCLFHLFQVWQYNHGIIDPGRMTRDYYFAVLGKTEKPPGADSLLLVDRSLVLSDSLPQAHRYKMTKTYLMPADKENSFIIQPEEGCSPKIFRIPYYELSTDDYVWVKISLDLAFADSITRPKLMASPCFMNKRMKAYNWNTISVNEHAQPIKEGWVHFSTYYLTPELRLKSDILNVQLENPERGKFLVRNFKLEVFERKIRH